MVTSCIGIHVAFGVWVHLQKDENSYIESTCAISYQRPNNNRHRQTRVEFRRTTCRSIPNQKTKASDRQIGERNSMIQSWLSGQILANEFRKKLCAKSNHRRNNSQPKTTNQGRQRQVVANDCRKKLCAKSNRCRNNSQPKTKHKPGCQTVPPMSPSLSPMAPATSHKFYTRH
jgi:hypothetical protein